MENPEDFVSRLLGMFSEADRLPRRQKRTLLRYLCDGYASANFAKENEQKRTLDEADHMKVVADMLAKDLTGVEFDHYTLEEIYSRPVVKDETVEARAKELKGRAEHSYRKAQWNMQASGALYVARQAVLFYEGGSKKLGGFWKQVVAVLEPESVKELSP